MTNWFFVGLGLGLIAHMANPYVAQMPFFGSYVDWVYVVAGAIAIFAGLGKSRS